MPPLRLTRSCTDSLLTHTDSRTHATHTLTHKLNAHTHARTQPLTHSRVTLSPPTRRESLCRPMSFDCAAKTGHAKNAVPPAVRPAARAPVALDGGSFSLGPCNRLADAQRGGRPAVLERLPFGVGVSCQGREQAGESLVGPLPVGPGIRRDGRRIRARGRIRALKRIPARAGIPARGRIQARE